MILSVLLPGRRGRCRWPSRLAGDKGYSYPGIWRWLDRRRIGRVIPTRKGQPRVADFDEAEYRRRNIIERVIGWYKEFSRLLTRLEKLPIHYVACWIVATIFRPI